MTKEKLGLDPFHINQFGFCKRKNTVDALRRVVELADSFRRKKRICVLAAVDIKNVFNALTGIRFCWRLKRERCPGSFYVF